MCRYDAHHRTVSRSHIGSDFILVLFDDFLVRFGRGEAVFFLSLMPISCSFCFIIWSRITGDIRTSFVLPVSIDVPPPRRCSGFRITREGIGAEVPISLPPALDPEESPSLARPEADKLLSAVTDVGIPELEFESCSGSA